MGLPYIPGHIRAFLLADPTFSSRCVGGCTVKKAPPDVTQPFAVVQMPGSVPVDDQGWALRPLMQINAWCPETWTADPDPTTWDLIDAAWNVFKNARYVNVTDTRGTAAYKARLVDGPLPTEDLTRGDGNPLQGYLIRVELTLQRN